MLLNVFIRGVSMDGVRYIGYTKIKAGREGGLILICPYSRDPL